MTFKDVEHISEHVYHPSDHAKIHSTADHYYDAHYSPSEFKKPTFHGDHQHVTHIPDTHEEIHSIIEDHGEEMTPFEYIEL